MANYRKITFLAFILAISVITILKADIVPGFSANNLAEQGTIRGMVADVSGSRIADAIVAFYNPDGLFIDSTMTGTTGEFHENLPAGDYRVSCWARGFIREFYPNAYFMHASSLVKISPKINVQIAMVLKRGGIINGHISTHNPNGGKFTVSAIKIDNPYLGWQCDGSALVYENGQYSLGGLISGHYKVFIRGDGYQIQYYPMVQNYNEATIIYIDDNQIVNDIDFDLLLPAFGRVSGHVIDIGYARPLADVSIFASQWSPDNSDPGVCVARTDANGYYEFNIVTGDYIISARSGGLQLTGSEFMVYYDGRFSAYLADVVRVECGQTRTDINFNVDLRKNYNLYISGSLFNERDGAPISGARMTALDYFTGRQLACAVTTNTGDFQIDNVSDGPYLLQYSGVGLIPAFWPGVWGWQQAEIVMVDGGSAELYNGGAITQDYGTPGLSISGRVDCPDSVLGDVRIYAVNHGNDMVAFGRTDYTGNYSLSSGITEGVYTVFADLYGFDGAYYPGIVAVDLLENPHVENVNIMLIPSVLGLEVEPVLPQEDRLLANYPNPFNSGTNILFESRSEGLQRFEIYDIAGRLCRTLVTRVKPGINEIYWDGADNSHNKVASGIYFYRVAGTVQARKMSLIK
jgi:hypothetical protein